MDADSGGRAGFSVGTAGILGEMGTDARPLVRHLLDLLKDESPAVRSEAYKALNKILAQ